MKLLVEARCDQGRTDHQIMLDTLRLLVEGGLRGVSVRGVNEARGEADARELTELRLYAWELERKLEAVLAERERPALAIGDRVPLDQVELAHVRAVVEKCNGNRAEASRVLQVSQRTLYRKLGLLRAPAREERAT